MLFSEGLPELELTQLLGLAPGGGQQPLGGRATFWCGVGPFDLEFFWLGLENPTFFFKMLLFQELRSVRWLDIA